MSKSGGGGGCAGDAVVCDGVGACVSDGVVCVGV